MADMRGIRLDGASARLFFESGSSSACSSRQYNTEAASQFLTTQWSERRGLFDMQDESNNTQLSLGFDFVDDVALCDE